MSRETGEEKRKLLGRLAAGHPDVITIIHNNNKHYRLDDTVTMRQLSNNKTSVYWNLP